MTTELANRRPIPLLRPMLAIVAVAVAFSVTVGHAGPLHCGPGGVPLFGEQGYRCETVANNYSPAAPSNPYGFDPYPDGFSFTNELTFDSILRDFTLYMSAFFVTPGDPAFLARIPAGQPPATYLTTTGPSWIYFYVEDLQPPDCVPDHPSPCGEPQQGSEYGPDTSADPDLKAWYQTVTWFSAGAPPDNAFMLHDPRGGDNFFGNNITVPGSYEQFVDPCDEAYGCDPPSGPIDPRIVGSADDFSATTVVTPEPGTIMLVGFGGAALLGAARRRLKR